MIGAHVAGRWLSTEARLLQSRGLSYLLERNSLQRDPPRKPARLLGSQVDCAPRSFDTASGLPFNPSTLLRAGPSIRCFTAFRTYSGQARSGLDFGPASQREHKNRCAKPLLRLPLVSQRPVGPHLLQPGGSCLMEEEIVYSSGRPRSDP